MYQASNEARRRLGQRKPMTFDAPFNRITAEEK
jgi:hypothetical protein